MSEDLREQLQHLQRLDSVGQLVGGIAHDFNNLLSVILSYAAFAEKALPEGDPIRDDVEKIRAAGTRAASLTQQLLMFTKRQDASPEVVDVNTVVGDMERLLRRSLRENIRLTMTLTEAPLPVFADPRQISHVLLNLAVNARDAMPGGGTLDIVTSAVPRGSTPGSSQMAAITVRDTGVGMASDVLIRAHEPLFTTKGDGSAGLGLTVARSIIEEAGGTLTLESEVGAGATVHIALPATEAPSAGAIEAMSSPSSAETGETVLLVEDDSAVLELTSRTLAQAGYVVIAAQGADDALRQAERSETRIDLLLSDVVMPQISGIDLAVRLRVARPDLRVVFMTGYSRDFLAREAHLGADVALVGKPFTAFRLLDVVRSALGEPVVPIIP